MIAIDTTAPARLQLQRGQTSRLTGAAHLASSAGTIWVTIDHDPRDWVLEAGETLDVADGAAELMVSALGGPATLELRPLP
ncbi:DUF2917 domain-containing protein [Pelomonas sp. KK5]|uniref:DUF2917 domain-containing protein n=1 Tax=Pelomonas sp. KK5 TaxID=1855730 RepID=UPI00097BB4B1|nr:DUF2917 domain-containing protein [Pelomonas sp. KK5]